MNEVRKPVVVIVGGGFGGIAAAEELRRIDAEIYILDKENYHLFQPLLYQVATAALSPADIAYPIRTIFRNAPNITVYLGEVSTINLPAREVIFDNGKLTYDYLVIAAGATHSYFGNEDWRVFAPGLKEIEDATEIRKRVLLAFEAAELEEDEEARRRLLTFVIVGGGPTGVELAGALKEIACETIPKDYRKIDTATARVVLVQSGDRLLPAMPEKLSHAAEGFLRGMGVELLLNCRVTAIDTVGVKIGDNQLASQNVFWAAGVQASPIGKTLSVPLDASGRVVVAGDLSIPGHPNVFVIGDLAAMIDADSGKQVPGVAQGAVQSGRFVGKILRAEIMDGVTVRPKFRYNDKGTMATIGRAKAVAQIGRFHFSGFFAWVLWSLVHVLVLVGFRNRVVVMLQWAMNFLTFQNGARLITGVSKTTIRRFRRQN